MDIKKRVSKKKHWQKAGFTIEASFLIPFIFFCILYILQIGINFLQESMVREPYDKLGEFQVVERFYTMQKWKEVMEDK